MKISFVVSTRDNINYLKWSYDSIRKNQGNHEVWICYGIDHCTDGTQEWIEEIKKVDPFVKSIENKTGKRLGHTIMYDQIINELVETDIAIIFHSDMYLCSGAIDSIERLMYDGMKSIGYVKNANRIVSLTRIEPPLHPPGPEKIVADFGTEPENFNETGLLKGINNLGFTDTTNGVFAPWSFFVDEFKAIGGHDALFAPQSKEDSDIFNRFKLNGCEFIQTWQGFVYHLTCRGSRYNPNLTTVGQNSPEWEQQNIIASRNFIRKWGHFVQHDEYLHPIIPHKYKVVFNIINCNYDLLYALEPWCSHCTVHFNSSKNLDSQFISEYIKLEQRNTLFDLNKKFYYDWGDDSNSGVFVEIDGKRFDQSDFEIIQKLSNILDESGDVGEFEVGNLRIQITSLNTYEHDLIVCNNEKIELN